MFYNFSRFLVKIFYTIVYRLEAVGLENVPAEGPVILCSNHISVMDPPTIGVKLKRTVRFMAKQELFEIPLFNVLIRKLGAFPVKRGGVSKESIRTVINVLEEGGVIGIFPEGTRKSTGAGKRGAATFALKTKAVVIPVAIIGNYIPFKKMKVVYGKPVELDDLREQTGPEISVQATERIMGAIHTIKNEHAA